MILDVAARSPFLGGGGFLVALLETFVPGS